MERSWFKFHTIFRKIGYNIDSTKSAKKKKCHIEMIFKELEY